MIGPFVAKWTVPESVVVVAPSEWGGGLPATAPAPPHGRERLAVKGA